jgi:hypothetical protein
VERGDVFHTSVLLPDRANPGGPPVPTPKFVVVLRGGPRTVSEREVPVVVASTDRRQLGQPLRPFEVSVGQAEGFAHETILDCRWPYTLEKSYFQTRSFRFRLGTAKMDEVSVAIVSGLQMYAPRAPETTAG